VRGGPNMAAGDAAYGNVRPTGRRNAHQVVDCRASEGKFRFIEARHNKIQLTSGYAGSQIVELATLKRWKPRAAFIRTHFFVVGNRTISGRSYQTLVSIPRPPPSGRSHNADG